MQFEISINFIEEMDKMTLFLNAFERQRNVKIDLLTFDWSEAWAELMKISLYGHGPIISETGSTWMSSLAGQNCLRPFKPNEVATIGGADKFLQASWQSCVDFDNVILAIPWTLNTYLAYYRRDLLAQAGVDETSAFTTIENFVHTLEKLQKIDMEIPFAIPTAGNGRSVLHNACSFVWKMGGELITPDGKQVLFSTPNTLAGLKEYFGLYRFMPPAARNLLDEACIRAYLEGRAAITFRSPDLLTQIKNGKTSKQVAQNNQVTIQPGIPFVGGSNLVIWKHIPPVQEAVAVELVHYLTSTGNMLTQFNNIGYIPANLGALDQVEGDQSYLPLTQSLKTGRALPRVHLWGLVEDRLVKALNHIWQVIFDTPEPNLDRIIESTLLPLEERLNITLSQ